MLSAVFLVIVGVVLAIVHSYRKNRRLLADGGRAYRPAPGLIGWDAASSPAAPAAHRGAGRAEELGGAEGGAAGGRAR